MKKFGIVIFLFALIAGIVVSKFFSFGSYAVSSPFSFVFSSKVQGSGNVVTESRNTGEFTGIKVGSIFDVTIKKGSETKVRIEAEDNILELVSSYVDDETLYLKTKKNFNAKRGIKVFITTPNIERLRTSGVSRIEFAEVTGESMKIRSSGASKIILKGSVNELDVRMSGASRIEATELVTAIGKVRGSGASKLKAHFEKELRARVSGASSVKYKGSPEIEKKVSGVGSLKKL